MLVATHEIVDASIEGDYAKLADRAQQIHDSFILEQAMTKEDRRTLCASFLLISSNWTKNSTHSQLNWLQPRVLAINSC